ncbi:MAG: phosphoserine phosphatase SerB [Cryobacterium sp.]|nr:phosphoserine phosphatase SerB [Cryobacterium sp.]
MPRFLVVLDVDSTLIEDEIIELLAVEAGTRDEVAAITSEAMNGRMDFETSLRTRVATLKGLPETAFAKVAASVTVTTGVPKLIDAVQCAGGRVGVVSGGFHEVIDPLAFSLGLDRWKANCLEVKDGKLTGELSGQIIDAQAKADILKEWATVYSIPLSQCIAIGDGANDLPMMAQAGLSIGFDAKPPVRDKANLILDVRDLSLVLPLIGLS